MTDTVRFEVSGPVATITLNRPDRLNAMTEELIAAVLVLLEQVERGRGRPGAGADRRRPGLLRGW